MDDSIEIKDVGLNIDQNLILDKIDLKINPGELLGIIGPNGAGKTSLLRIILNIFEPTEGEIQVNGKSTGEYKSKELYKILSYVAQREEFTFPFKVFEVVLLGRIPHSGKLQFESNEDYRIVEEALETVGMSNFTDRSVVSLSGGEKQLVFIAKALAQDTKFILLDEPTSNLDINFQLKIMNLLKNLCNKGRGIIVVLHDLFLARKFCDKLLVLNNGEMNHFGDPGTVLNEKTISEVFNVNASLVRNEATGNVIIDPNEPLN